MATSTVALPPLPAELTQAQAEAYLAQVRRAMAGMAAPAVAVLDASALHEFDSSALAVLLALRREALARGIEWRIEGLPERARALAGLYGIGELLPA